MIADQLYAGPILGDTRRMFELALEDHLRSTFGHVVRRHEAHGAIARVMARRSLWLRALEALLITAVAWATVTAALSQRPELAAAGAVLSVAALLVLMVHLGSDFDRNARAHAECAAHLWRVAERYRALLSDLSDGAVPMEGARRERDALIDELHSLSSRYPAEEQRAAAHGAQPSRKDDLSDEQIDRLLPASLRKIGKPAA